jgi:hypothetical protein
MVPLLEDGRLRGRVCAGLALVRRAAAHPADGGEKATSRSLETLRALDDPLQA